MNVKKLTELAILTALALIIFVIELQIPNPVPIPGVKLGLANIITVFAVYHYRASEVALIVFTRVFLGSFFGGNMMALMYSMAFKKNTRDVVLVGYVAVKTPAPGKIHLDLQRVGSSTS